MKKNNKKTNKIVSFVFVWVLFFAQIFPLSVSAVSLDELINANADLISNSDSNGSYGTINSADNDPGNLSSKQQSPSVEINFLSQGPIKQGTKITANAIPGFFNNSSDPKKLYFTWYLKKASCDLTDSDYPSGTKINEDGDIVKIKEETSNSKISSCDKDGDRIITVNDWKITASKIIVSSGFNSDVDNLEDSEEVDYDKAIDSKMSAYKAVPEISSSGWRRGFLENGNGEIYQENDDGVIDCYVYESDTNLSYELRNVEPVFENSCPANYHRACVAKKEAKCNILNPDFSCSDAINAKNAIPPQAYDIPKGIIDTGTPNKSLFSACSVVTEGSDDFCSVTDIRNFKAEVSCDDPDKSSDDGYVSMCVRNDNQNIELKDASSKSIGVIVGTKSGSGNDVFNDDKICSAMAKPDIANSCSEYSTAPTIFLPSTESASWIFTPEQQNCQTIREGLVNGIKDEFNKVLVTGNKDLAPKCGFKKADNLCMHLFPILPDSVKRDDGKHAITGDGDFGIKEKEFWGADPTKPATRPGGKDEEKIVGLGVDKFEWIYSMGDEVGVIVEGDSVFASDHGAGYKRTWAFPNGKCDALDDIDGSNKKSRGFYLENNQGFLTTNVDLNECLEENLLKPDDDGLYSLKVELGAAPENPINDPDGDGSILSVVSTSSNLSDTSGLLYQWSVQKSKSGSNPPTDDTSWLDITNKMVEGGSFSETDKQGIGKTKLDIKLNIKDVKDGMIANSFNGTFYLRIKLRIRATAADGSQNAEGYIIVRVKQQENKISVYRAIADFEGMLSMDKGIAGQSAEICKNIGSGRCYVAKNKILGLEVNGNSEEELTDFSWKVNGAEMICSENYSSSCELRGNKLFLPILGNEGEAIDVVATARNENNESIEVSKRFVISSNEFGIIAPESVGYCSMNCLDSKNICPKYLGYYNQLSGEKIPDCSFDVWEAKAGKTIILESNSEMGVSWTIDGQEVPEFQDKDQMMLLVDKFPGENYNIAATTRFTPENIELKNNLRKALYKNWGLQPEDISEEEETTGIQINVMENYSQDVASSKNKNFAASLISYLPNQTMFLFKIAVTSVTLLASMSLLFALIPGTVIRKMD